MDVKPAARPTKKSAAAAAVSTPAKSSHRHSKTTVPASPAVEEVVIDAIVVPAAPLPAKVVNTEDIARLAYSFWEQRNYANGHAEEDWFRAMKTLSAGA